MYKVTIPDSSSISKQVILPISMSQTLERGKALECLLKKANEIYKPENVTVLLCDYLNRHNLDSDKEALLMGEKFIDENKLALSENRVLRWKEYMESKKDFDYNLNLITDKSSPKSLFFGKMSKVHRNCKSSTSLEASVKYQREEFSLILCMKEFDAIIYPRKPSTAMNYLYSEIEGKKPLFIHAKVRKNSPKKAPSLLFFPPSKTKIHNQPMHISLRLLLQQIDVLLQSPEIPSKSKLMFLEKLRDTLKFSGGSLSLLNNEASTGLK